MIYGWDISTSIIGLAVFDDEGKFVRAEHCDLRKIDGLNEKADRFQEFVQSEIRVSGTHLVEERLGNFAAGRSMLQVLMKLAAFNAMCSYILHKNGGGVSHIHPSTWKALMKKEGLFIPKGSKEKKQLTLDHVYRREKEFPRELNKKDNPQPWMYDMADAYCIGRAGYLKLCTERESSKPSEPPLATKVGRKATKASSSVTTPRDATEPTESESSQST